VIALNHITAGYPNAPQVLHNLSYAFDEPGVYALMGASGIGKTTLLRVLAGLEKPVAGNIVGTQDKRIVMMFQEDRLLPWSSVLQNVLLGMQEPDDQQALEILKHLDIGGTAHLLLRELSGGMQRRVALARAIAFNAHILLMDEPFTGVDTQTVARIAPYVRNAAPFILFTSHSVSDAAAMGANMLELVDCSTLRIYTAQTAT